METAFLYFRSRVLCVNGLSWSWGPAASRAGRGAGSQPVTGKNSQGGGEKPMQSLS